MLNDLQCHVNVSCQSHDRRMLWPIAPIKSFRSRPPPTYSVHSRNSRSCVAVAAFFVFFGDSVLTAWPKRFADASATHRAAARLTFSCGRRDVVGGCSTLRNHCSSGLMFGCCGPTFLLSWPFFPTRSKWTLFPSGRFFQLWPFFLWTYFPWTFFPNI